MLTLLLTLVDDDGELVLEVIGRPDSHSDADPRGPACNDIPTNANDPHLQEPEQYLSTKRDIKNVKEAILSEINNTVSKLLCQSRTLPSKEPLLRDRLQSQFLFEILSKIYGTTTEKQLQRIILAKDSQSLLRLDLLLRVVLAATVSHWVLEGKNEIILKDPTERDNTIREAYFARSMLLMLPSSLRVTLTLRLWVRISRP